MKMDELAVYLKEVFCIELLSAILSNPRDREKAWKVRIRPVLKKEELVFQFEVFIGKQVFHENLSVEEAVQRACEWLEQFRQMQIDTKSERATVLVSKKGKVTVKRKKVSRSDTGEQNLSHNREKQYLLREGMDIPFLKDLGVMTQDGKIVHSRFDKFRQINRYLEFIDDVLPRLPKDREITILDFGCGKSYLTFAMYYFLHEMRAYEVRMAALVTDGLRAEYLKREGYDTQILEFIDMEHTPKNILIRAVKTGKKAENQRIIDVCEDFLHVKPTIGKLL